MMKVSSTVIRKKDHIKLCLSDKVAYQKKNGLENYEFEHYAITEVDYNEIDLETKFFSSKISLPFLISCMTGGTSEANNINSDLAKVARELNIPIGVGSQRQALEEKKYHYTYRVIRKNAGNVPILGNLGAAQIARSKKIIDEVRFLIDLIEADAMMIHVNPLQELLQKEGEPNFKGLLKAIEKICLKIDIPIIVKEVGTGISKNASEKLLEVGVKGIDVAGAGGTSWGLVELLRNNEIDNYFGEWGLPTSYCLRKVNELKKDYNFLLIGSGGINSGVDIAKSLALGADITGSARIILQELKKNGIGDAIKLINNWFITVKKIMYLTGCASLNQLREGKLFRKEELY